MHKAHHSINEIDWQLRAYPTVDFRYLFYFQDPLHGRELLDFRNETTYPLQQDGRAQAKDLLSLGKGTGFRAIKDWVADREAMQEEWGDFGNYLWSFMP